MKRALMCGVAALVWAGAASAGGFIAGGYQSTDAGGGSEDIYSVAGRVSLGDHVILDGGYATGDGGGDYYQIGGHFFGRGENWLAGGFAAYESADGDIDDFSVGAEGQYYLDRVTLGLSVGYSNSSDFLVPGLDIDGWTVNGDVRFFITDNFTLRGSAGWGQISAGGVSEDGTAFGVGVEYQFDESPISLFAGYRTTDIVFTDVDTWGIGLRWNFDEGTLKQRDRKGERLNRTAGLVENFLGGVQPQ